MITENFNTYTFEFLLKVKSKLTEFIEEPDVTIFKSIGSATADSVEYAIFLALQHKEGFLNQVVGYRIMKDNNMTKLFREAIGKDYIGVEFYRLKKDDKESFQIFGDHLRG